MFLSAHGQASGADAFLFSLAVKLGKSVQEIRRLPMSEIVQWQAYLKVQSTLEDLAMKAAQHG